MSHLRSNPWPGWTHGSSGAPVLRFYKKEPVSRSALIKLLFGECARVAIDATFGFPLGMAESLDGRQACYFGSQG